LANKIYADDVPEVLKKNRLERVLKLQREISRRKNQERVGSVEEILVENAAKLGRGQMMGRTRTNRIVNFPGPEELSGKSARVRITAAAANSLLGELIPAQ
jgi:tRNA-2-methylthio-N6-dimethylallyladenosine synthase